MKRVWVWLAIVAVTLGSLTTTAASAEPVHVDEDWVIEITNWSFSGWIRLGDEAPQWLVLEGFSGCDGRSTPTIEWELVDPLDQWRFRTLVFDFHAGQACGDDYAYYSPICTCGSEWRGTMSFDWRIYCTNPRVSLSVMSWHEYGRTEWWRAPNGTGWRSGSATFEAGTAGWPPMPAYLFVSFDAVPEPSGLSGLLVGVPAWALVRRKHAGS